MTSAQHLNRTAERLRREFDDTFVRERSGEPPLATDLLEVRVGGRAYGLQLEQVEALHRDRRLVRAPSPRADLLGLANLRGAITPVHDLSRLLGHAPCPQARWLAQIKSREPFGLAFDQYERHLKMPLGSIIQPSRSERIGRFVQGHVSFESRALCVIDLLALYAEVTTGAALAPASEREELP